VRQFEHIVATELPALFDDFNLDESTREKLLGYVEKLQQWMCGELTWHKTIDRYKEFELRNSASPIARVLGGPTGLGTSAARIGSLLGAGRTESGLHSIDDSLPATRLSDLSLSQ
jgi:germacradienol/geosmin synthase